MDSYIDLEQIYGAKNYQPLPVVLVRGQGAYVWDQVGNRYLDMMSAYSAVSHGHCHPKLIQALTQQASTLAVTSRAFYTDKLGPFLEQLCKLTGQDQALPMNTGAEAVETALKAARRWGYVVKGILPEKAEIIACQGNFHGRTIAIIAMSSEQKNRANFGPFPAGFKQIPFGDSPSLESAITPNTAAFLVEPIQGEGGIILPPTGYLKECQAICKKHNVLMICDEIQTGMGRTGKILASQHEDVVPDGLLLGKALGGGLLPVSAFLAKKEVMDVFGPGDHGSTFGGNPLAAAVGLAAINVLLEEDLLGHAVENGDYLIRSLQQISSPVIKEIRGKGLLIGMEINPEYASANSLCLQLLKYGLLSKDTHGTVIRLAPPLVISKEQIDVAVDAISAVVHNAEKQISN